MRIALAVCLVSQSIGQSLENLYLKIKVIIHEAEEGGYWAEVPAIPGCATQGEALAEILSNIQAAVEGCLTVEPDPATLDVTDRIMEITI